MILRISLMFCMAFISLGLAIGSTVGQEPNEQKAEATTSDKDDAKLKVLIVDGQNNHAAWPKTTFMMKSYLEQTGKFSVDIKRTKYTWKGGNLVKEFPLDDGVKYEDLKKSKSDPDFKPVFSDYDVVVNNNGYGAAAWPESTQKAFEEYMKNGGGFVSIHAADNCFPNWPAYNEMIGLGGWGGRTEKSGPYVYFDADGNEKRDESKGSGGGHGPQHEFSLVLRNDEHPITKGLPTEFLHAKDELYERLRGPAINMTILATAFASPDKKGSGRHEPMLMTISFGKGRVFHSTLGHADYSMECVGFITTFLRGTEWAATGKVTIPVPDDYPSADKPSKRAYKKAAPKPAVSASGPDKGWGSLKGKITVKGQPPANQPEDVGSNKDKDACLVDGKVPLDDAILVSDKNELANVFVYMYTGRGAETPETFHPMYEKSKAKTLTLDNQKCRFVPKALFVRTGQKLTLKNSDKVGHNCRIATMSNEKNVNIPKFDSIEVTFAESERIPGDVFCDIHKWMDSLIFIRDNPYVAITDANGNFSIENIPPGKWKFQFWHKKGGYLSKLEIDGFDLDRRRGHTEVEVKDGETVDMGTAVLPAKALNK